jgi:hypothetical protein
LAPLQDYDRLEQVKYALIFLANPGCADDYGGYQRYHPWSDMHCFPTLPKLHLHSGGSPLRDIHDVLRGKQAEQAQLGKQIEALQKAAEQLRSVAHLLNEEAEGANAGATV